MRDMDSLGWLSLEAGISNVLACTCDRNGLLPGKPLDLNNPERVLAGAMRTPVSRAVTDIRSEDIEASAFVFETGDAGRICHHCKRPEPMCLDRQVTQYEYHSYLETV
ncbi:hypothetical protein [Jannaschia rubra]|uniref:Uncharacterized protein n=2 Tax=Jannaschia rubra TaxID=282197 RepID=A0A0M6XMD2_9RHOB|nr:hypothetical protein [Jannaschia rubra]CTQ31343.1 hypothetical protein JAN5088_00098 [Jannaschia rubra]SFF81306.1 hypothetical protein SAMN04488517_101319 [Jannaschia rubra]